MGWRKVGRRAAAPTSRVGSSMQRCVGSGVAGREWCRHGVTGGVVVLAPGGSFKGYCEEAAGACRRVSRRHRVVFEPLQHGQKPVRHAGRGGLPMFGPAAARCSARAGASDSRAHAGAVGAEVLHGTGRFTQGWSAMRPCDCDLQAPRWPCMTVKWCAAMLRTDGGAAVRGCAAVFFCSSMCVVFIQFKQFLFMQ